MSPNDYSMALEAVRRCPSETGRHPNVILPMPLGAQALDYAGAGLKVQAGLQALDEAIPNKQTARTVLAFKAMQEGVQELAVWLRANGYEV